MKLSDMGWMGPSSDEKLNTDSVARITSVHRSLCKAITTSGDLNIYLSGRFHSDVCSGADKPATGDFIKVSPTFIDEQNVNAAILEEILPRKSKISRFASGPGVDEQVLASNVNFAFIVTSANDDFNLNRLQRYVLLAKEGSVVPIVLLSKIDLMDNFEVLVAEIKGRLGEVEVIPLSSIKDLGIKKVQEKLSIGATGVFLGSSGVGKSTIVNKLLGKQIQATKEIREDDSKGRHATTARELFFLPSGGMIIDTAGLREVQVLASEEAMASTFKEISELIQDCKFSNCTHENEPGCAINEALESGNLSKEEYNNYLKLQKEAAYTERKISQSKGANAKERWKTITKNHRARRKFEGKD